MNPIVLDPTKVIALILIASFGLDRIVTGILFLLSYRKSWRASFRDPASMPPGPKQVEAARKYKLLYGTMAAFLGVVVIAGYLKIRLLELMGLITPDPVTAAAATTAAPFPTKQIFDALITGLLLTGGAERVAEILKMMGPGEAGAAKSQPKPIEVTGRLVLEKDPEQTKGASV